MAFSRARMLLCGAVLGVGAAVGLSGCPAPEQPTKIVGQVKLTILHTSDIHSRLFDYDLDITGTDAALGLASEGTIARVGGVARISHILGRERARADRVLHLDGGDCFEGAPIFNFFSGEAEVRSLAEMGTDVMIVANHEFDRGPLNLGTQLEKWASFPVLAANYKFSPVDQNGSAALARVVNPWTEFDLDGLRVGVIGMGNLSSVTSLFEQPNSSGITPLNTVDTAQFYIDMLRPLVDVVVLVTHLGVDVDEDMIAHTSGADLVLGGHNHIVLNPPKEIFDCQDTDAAGNHVVNILSPDAQADGQDNSKDKYVQRRCNPRKVVLQHSGAFAKYVGRTDMVLSNVPSDIGDGYDPIDRFELIDHEYTLIPVTEDVPQDPHMVNLLDQYKINLDALIDLNLLVGYAPAGALRSQPAGGDSALGNMISTAMWLRQGIQTDFSFTNTLGIRADLVPGPVTIDQVFNVFPFDNSITKMQVTGTEVQEVMDFAARRAASRSCTSQIQIAGARVVQNCNGCNRPDLVGPCKTDNDCPTGGTCNASTLHCNPQPCAEAVYIGRNPSKSCFTDDDCSCDPSDQVNGACQRFCSDDNDCTCTNAAKQANGGHCPKPAKPVIGQSCDLSHAASDGSYPGTCKILTGSCDTFNQFDPSCDPTQTTCAGACYNPIDPTSEYELATSNYLAAGGSGFTILKANTTQLDTLVQQRDALVDYVRSGKPCGYSTANGTPEGLKACSTDADCATAQTDDAVCTCVGHVAASGTSCTTQGSCDPGEGRCVPRACREDVAAFERRTCESGRTPGAQEACETSLNPCEIGGELCKFLACVDNKVTNFADGRQIMVGR